MTGICTEHKTNASRASLLLVMLLVIRAYGKVVTKFGLLMVKDWTSTYM